MPVITLTKEQASDECYCPCEKPDIFEDKGVYFLFGLGTLPQLDLYKQLKPISNPELRNEPTEDEVLLSYGSPGSDENSVNMTRNWSYTEVRDFRENGDGDFYTDTQRVVVGSDRWIDINKFSLSEEPTDLGSSLSEIITNDKNGSVYEMVEHIIEHDEGTVSNGIAPRFKSLDVVETTTGNAELGLTIERKGVKTTNVKGTLVHEIIDEIDSDFFRGGYNFSAVNPPRRDIINRSNIRFDEPDNVLSEDSELNATSAVITSTYSLSYKRDLKHGCFNPRPGQTRCRTYEFIYNESWTVRSARTTPNKTQFWVNLRDVETIKHHPGEAVPVELDLVYDDFGGFGEPFLSYGVSSSGTTYDVVDQFGQPIDELTFLGGDKGVIHFTNPAPTTKNNTILSFDFGYSHQQHNGSLEFTEGRVATMFSEEWTISTNAEHTYDPSIDPFSGFDETNVGGNKRFLSHIIDLPLLTRHSDVAWHYNEWGDDLFEKMVF